MQAFDDKDPAGLLGGALLDAIRQAVREEVQNLVTKTNDHGADRRTILTVEELADTLKVPKSWVYDRTRRKKDPIPHVRVGRYPRFDLNTVISWLETQRDN